MSFILDALKKADQQRQAHPPAPVVAAPLAAQENHASSLRRYVWLALILLMIVGGLGVLSADLLKQSHTAPSAPLLVGPQGGLVSATQPHPLPATSPKRAPIEIPPAPVRPLVAGEVSNKPQTSVRVVSPVVVAKVAVEAPKPPSLVHSDERATIITPSSVALEASTVAPVAFADLPVAIQQEIPKPAILVHSYASVAKARFVLLGDRKLHEGDALAAGLKLEQITADGMVLSYKGFRFHRGINP